MSSTQIFQTTHKVTRSHGREVAHIFERVGLAMMGASGGLFVAVNATRINIELLASPMVALGFVIYGAIGFYLGVDLPQPNHENDDSGTMSGQIERLSAAGTLCAAFAAFASVCGIVIDADPHGSWALLVGCGWLIGVTMQIVAGTRARRVGVNSTANYAATGPRKTT